MSVLLAVCAVVITIAFTIIAVALIRTLKGFEEATDAFKKTAAVVRASVEDAATATRQVQELAGSLESVVPPLRRAATRVEELSDRAMRLSNTVLNEVEGPIRTTVAMITGVRAATRSLVGSLTRRPAPSTSNGGSSDA
jgi:uncharacterized protein YoxC